MNEDEIKRLSNSNNHLPLLDLLIKNNKSKSFLRHWEIEIFKILNEDEVRINSLVIGCIGELPERIYIGSNSNKILIYDLVGIYLGCIELDEGLEVKKLLITDIRDYQPKKELIVQTSNDTVLFYGLNSKGFYQELSHCIISQKAEITSIFSIPLGDNNKPIFRGNSNGDVIMTSFSNMQLDSAENQIIPISEKLYNEKIASISGSVNLIDSEFGLLVGYKNGIMLLFDKYYNLVAKTDIDREIEEIFINNKDNTIYVTTDDNYVFQYIIENIQFTYKWSIFIESTISTLIINEADGGFFALSEDTGTMSRYDSNGHFCVMGDPSFEATTGVIYNENLFLASRIGEICMFNTISEKEITETNKLIYNSYLGVLKTKTGNEFYEFFNSEFESDDSVGYFKQFLINFLSNEPDIEVINKLEQLFSLKKYNTEASDGLVSNITNNSILSRIILEVFPNFIISSEIRNYEDRIKYKIKETNLYAEAELILKTDPLYYIKLMTEIRINNIDKIWVQKIFDDDDVVGINFYHDPFNDIEFQLLIATRKGFLYLLDRLTGAKIWEIKLAEEDGEITNIEVADVCSDKLLEIIIGCKNRHNSILVLSKDKDKFRSSENKVELKWSPEYPKAESFNLYFTRIRVPGIDDAYTLMHKVLCFDFDNNNVKDLIISSENGKFDVFYFDSINKNSIAPKTKVIEYEDDDVLEFEIIRDGHNEIILFTGTNSGKIEKQKYNGSKFVKEDFSFSELDAKITDLLVTDIDKERYVLYSSDDNFIYCLSDDLEYKWAFKTEDDVKSISVLRCSNESLVLAISKDKKLYALDFMGNKKWDYPLYSPLDKFFVINDNIVVADSDGNIHSLKFINSDDIEEKMEKDLSDIKFEYLKLIEEQGTNKYVKIYAIKKLLSNEPSDTILNALLPLLSDEIESEAVVRCQSVILLTDFVMKSNFNNKQICEALIGTLKDYSPEVRIESIKSFFLLFETHKLNKINYDLMLFDIVHDDDLWVKEYLAGALFNNLTIPNEVKWKLLINLMLVNNDDEWILNETAMAVGNLLNNIKNDESLIDYLYQLFILDLGNDTLEKILINILDSNASILFKLFVFIKNQDINKITALFPECQKIFGNYNIGSRIGVFFSLTNSSIEIFRQPSVEDICENKIINNISQLIYPYLNLTRLIENINDYINENVISDKIVYLNYALDSIEELNKNQNQLNSVDWNLVDLSINKSLKELIVKTSRLLRENVYIDIEIENREISLNDNKIGDINFDLLNNGYTKIEEIEVIIKQNPQFEIIDNVGTIGDLVKGQRKKVYCKIKPKVIGALEIVFEISYHKCEIPLILSEKLFIKENQKKEWVPIENPYTCGIPVENNDVFVGRESLIEETLIAIKKDPVFVMGHRRMGKSSFVKYIMRNYFKSKSYIPVFISAELLDYSNINYFLYSFADPIVYELTDTQFITEEKASQYLGKIRGNGFSDFGIFFNDILRKVKKENKTLIAIVDEYPIIHENVEKGIISSQFTSYLRGYMQNNSQEFKMIYTGASSLKYLKSQYSSNIMGVGKSIVISFLNEDDVRKLIDKPTNSQLKFDDSAFQFLMDITFGQPFLVQIILSYLVNKLNKEKKSSTVFKESLEEGIEYFLDQAPHLRTDWGSFDNSDENRFISSDINWSFEEETIAKVYKQLIITAISDKWTKSGTGLSKEEIFKQLENSLKEFHTINNSIFVETLNIMAGTADILLNINNIYLIKIGLFREWVTLRMNYTYEKTLLNVKSILQNLK